ncbi:MAG: amino acid adenylation domain-containing protein [Muribaculaceae bacterium]
MDRKTIYGKLAEWVERQPNTVAVTEDGRSETYRELDATADAILAKLYTVQDVGTTDGEHRAVGIVMSHGAEMIAAMLAVLKSGAAYVPAEPSLPQQRIDYMMRTAEVSFVITDEFCRNLPVSGPMPDRSKPDGVAYILYTSGTSGRPKGVVVENHSVVNYAEAFEREFHVAPGDVMLQYSICSFDIFVEEVFTTLLNGATLAIPSKKVKDGSLADLMAFCERHGVTEISGFPYLLADMNRYRCCPGKLRLLISGGDVIRAAYITWLKDQDFIIYNTYGPSETTVCATYFRVDNAEPLDDGTYPIGKAVKGVEVKILDGSLREVPAGETGEICIFGEGVSRGYLGNPPEQQNFVTLGDGRRMYRSGDLGYILPDGNIAFLRRKDRQVMILGKRVEPEEVENVLNESPCVERGVVRAFTDEQGLAYLTAYFVPSHKNCHLSRIRKFLRSRLADFMVPEFFVKMDEIPLTRRGKVNDRALPVVMKEGEPE